MSSEASWREVNQKAQEICDNLDKEVGCLHPTLSGPCHQCVLLYLHGKLEEAANVLFDPDDGEREYDTDDLLRVTKKAFEILKPYKAPEEDEDEEEEDE